jgi:WS/DGAT/MGAT family acyltransferase
MGHYERLSALDAAFLSIETGSSHMHGGAVLIFDARPLRLPHGGIDIDRIREYIEASLQHVPRYLQRIDRVPVQRNPVWVDDERFNIRYHLRHSALPRPGTEQQLRELIGRIASQRLDRDRPLWEIWVIEGLESDRLALVGKVHHCMMDGITGISVMQRLLRSDADDVEAEPPPSREPRTSPRPGELLGDELRRGADRLRALWRGLGKLRDEPESVINTLLSAASDAATALGTGLTPASPTPLNPPQIGSYRRVGWLRLDLQKTREIRAALGCTVNDVVLATLAGAVRTFLTQRGADEAALAALEFRVLVPVNRRGRGADQRMGNRISLMLVQLPLGEEDPLERFRLVRQATQQTKRSGQHQAAERISDFGNWFAPALVGQGMRLLNLFRPYNLVVTNVPGPPDPLYLLGCRLLELYPVVPLYFNQALGVGLFSYNEGLYCGLNADWEMLPDLHVVVEAIRTSFEELESAAAAAAAANAGSESGPVRPRPDRPADRVPRRRARRRAGRAPAPRRARSSRRRGRPPGRPRSGRPSRRRR